MLSYCLVVKLPKESFFWKICSTVRILTVQPLPNRTISLSLDSIRHLLFLLKIFEQNLPFLWSHQLPYLPNVYGLTKLTSMVFFLRFFSKASTCNLGLTFQTTYLMDQIQILLGYTPRWSSIYIFVLVSHPHIVVLISSWSCLLILCVNFKPLRLADEVR